jgi:hypothetical protein
MNLSEISELMALSIGMNFALVVTNFIDQTKLTQYLKLYCENSKERVSQHSLHSLLQFENTRETIKYFLSINTANPKRYEVLITEIESEEKIISEFVNKFLQKSKTCLELAYLPKISLLLGLYALIVMGLAPFHEHYKLTIECSLLVFNVLIIFAVLVTISLEFIKCIQISYTQYFFYFIFSLVLLIASLFIFFNLILESKIILAILPYSLVSVIFIPFLSITFYLLKAFFINEYQIKVFKRRVKKLNHKDKDKLMHDMIKRFEEKDKNQLDDDIIISID